MKHQRSAIGLVSGLLLLAGIITQVVQPSLVYAAQITNRSLELQAGTTDGGSKPGGVVNHQFKFTLPAGSSVGSIQLQYCTLAAGTCVTPTGLLTTSATMGTQNGATGFSLNNTTNGTPYLYRASAAAISANTAVAYQLLSVTNPTDTNKTFFVRISSYASTDTSGSAVDTGTVTASTATPIILDGTMPESLVFCTGATVGLTGGVPDCATATPGLVSFNQLFSPTDTAAASSQMAASTNAGSGYVISVNGPTMTSGSNTITAMPTMTTLTRGTSQFGLNLRANTSAVSPYFTTNSYEVAPAPTGSLYRGQAFTGYDTVDNFKYVSGDPVAKSDNGGAGGTNAQIFTASYIVNVPGSQAAGTYTTTLTYICTPSF